MECKEEFTYFDGVLLFVLIETLWNVKIFCTSLISCFPSINRNIVECKEHTLSGLYCLALCINRNIVECKVIYPLPVNLHKLVLIETLWNVKNEKAKFALQQDLVLIETLWNVKCTAVLSFSGIKPVLIETLWNVK